MEEADNRLREVPKKPEALQVATPARLRDSLARLQTEHPVREPGLLQRRGTSVFLGMLVYPQPIIPETQNTETRVSVAGSLQAGRARLTRFWLIVFLMASGSATRRRAKRTASESVERP